MVFVQPSRYVNTQARVVKPACLTTKRTARSRLMYNISGVGSTPTSAELFGSRWTLGWFGTLVWSDFVQAIANSQLDLALSL